jgi:hypothetical protein
MSDEPLVWKKLGRLLSGKKDEEAQRAALQLASGLPSELTKLLNDADHSTPVLIRKIQGFIKREHISVDTAILEAYARKINAGKNVIEAITALRSSAHDAAALDLHRQRDEELSGEEHETKILGHEAERAKLRGTIDQHETARLEQELARARLQKRIAATRVQPIDDDFEVYARRELEHVDDVLVPLAKLVKETEARADISESAKRANIEWLQELAAEILQRRKKG